MAFMVDERMAYHRQIGFDHFYIYDNNSTDHLAASTALTALAPVGKPGLLAWLAFTWSRCHWTFHADIDYYLLPLVSPPTVQVIVAHVRRNSKCASSVVEMRFEGLRTHHDNLTTCPDTPVIETYVHRRTDKDAYDLGFGLVMSSAADALHHVHFAELQLPARHKLVKVARDVALGFHFSKQCWPQFHQQKCFMRGSVRDWDIPDIVNKTHPAQGWWEISKKEVVTDTQLRNFKHTLGPFPLARQGLLNSGMRNQ